MKQGAKNLSNKIIGNGIVVIPSITAVLFAIHPMHVESVAWASERKDVLYVFFFLLSLVGYVFYLSNNYGTKFLVVSFIYFILSLFSKGQAVVLPLVFLAIDYYLKRKIDKRMIIEKIPFFILSAIFGVIAIKAQVAESAINSDLADKSKILFTSSYGLFLYIFKAILPIGLSGAHPYPKADAGGIAALLYVAPAIILGLLFLVYRSIKSNRFVVFGSIFFLAGVFMMLKFIPVGDTIISERYSYLPYIGIFFIFGSYYNIILEKFKQYKTIVYAVLGVLILVLSVGTFQRCFIWKDTFSFWNDVAEKYPTYWRAPNNIAQGYLQKKDYDNAVKYFSKAIEVDKECPPVPYMWRGQIYLDNLKKNELAIADFKKVIDFPNKHDPTQIEARIDLGLSYYRNNQYDDALKIYEEVLQRDPNNAKAYQLMALVHSQKKELTKALDDYTKALQLNPSKDLLIEIMINRGSLYTDVLGRFNDAITDFKKVLELSPGNVDATLNTGITYYKKGEYDNAINIFNTAIQKDGKEGKLYYLRALCLAEKKDFANALIDINHAKSMGLQVEDNLIKTWESKK